VVGEGLPEGHGGRSPGLAAGSRVAGYLLEEEIGAGGMAVVFRARDERLDRLVALKLLTPGLAADEEFRRRFLREARAAAAVDDPHIIPVYEAGEAGGVLFLAMRLVSGGDVRGLLRREGPLPAARTAAIISHVAAALDAAHGAGDFTIGFCVEEQAVSQAVAAGDERYSLSRRADMIGEENAPLAVEAGAVIFGEPETRFTELVELLLDSVARMCSPR
jgi:serine/threonine protein kinase